MTGARRIARRRAWARTGLGLVVLGAVALPAAAHSRPDRSHESTALGSATSTRYQDPRGDVAAGGLDVASVTVSNDDSGKLTFVIEIPSHQTLPPGEQFWQITLYLDGDQDETTGDQGDEYAVSVSEALGATFNRWDASRNGYYGVVASSWASSFADGRWTLEFNRSLIGAASGLNFLVHTWSDVTVSAEDRKSVV